MVAFKEPLARNLALRVTSVQKFHTTRQLYGDGLVWKKKVGCLGGKALNRGSWEKWGRLGEVGNALKVWFFSVAHPVYLHIGSTPTPTQSRGLVYHERYKHGTATY